MVFECGWSRIGVLRVCELFAHFFLFSEEFQYEIKWFDTLSLRCPIDDLTSYKLVELNHMVFSSNATRTLIFSRHFEELIVSNAIDLIALSIYISKLNHKNHFLFFNLIWTIKAKGYSLIEIVLAQSVQSRSYIYPLYSDQSWSKTCNY